MKNLQAIRLTVFSLILFLLTGGVFAADGDVDSSFGNGLTSYGGGVYAGVRQPDGKVIVGGSFRVANGRYYHGLARFNADGTIDTGFNIGNGQVIGGVVLAVALQADGKILVGGSFHDWDQPDFPQTREPRGYLVRLNPNGSIDPSFIGFGSEAGPNYWVNKIVVQPDGNILVSGSFWMFGNAEVKELIRLNPNGELDTAFNANLGTGFSGSSTGLPVHAIALQSNGQILLGGEFASVNSVPANRLARLNTDGTLDTVFAANIGTGALGGGGVLSLAIQPTDGKILLGGSFEFFNGTPRHLMARINQDGTLDTAFDSVSGNNGGIEAFAIQPDGKIIVTGANGAFTDGKNSRPAIARLNAEDGSLDLTFDPGTGTSATNLPVLLYESADNSVYVGGNFFAFNDTPRLALTRLNTNGSLSPNFKPIIGNQANVNVLAVQADDKVLVGGDFHGAGNLMSPKIARYNADGSVDASFNAFSPGYIDGDVKAIAIQTDGKILIGGSFTYFGGVNKQGIARLNADGSRDTTFNGDANFWVNSIVVQTDGKIAIGGAFVAVNGELGHFGIARLNADGTTDMSFPATGCGANCSVEKITQQQDGKFLVGGTFSQFNGFSGIENMTRLNADGTLDNSFNLNLGSGFDSTVEDIAIQTDGKILVAGWFASVNGASSSRIVRLNANGTIDGAFSVGAGLDWTGASLAIQPNGKIIVAGYFGSYQGTVRQKIIRVNANGMLDTSFAEQQDPQMTINAVALDSHGKVFVGGYFNKYQNAGRYSIARLKNDGLNPTWGEDSKITIPDGNLDPDSQIGGAVAIDGDTAVVGDLADNDYQGAAYIYVRNGTNWTLQQKLTASDGAANDWFGVRVAIDGDTVIIGASQDNVFQGSAYIFVRNGTTWTEHQKLTAIDGAENDSFGVGVSIKGDYAVIGSSDDDVGGILNQGSAYVYQRIGTSWLFAQKLTALDGAADDGFGWSVSISGGRIIIGAPGGIGGNTSPGSAYIFVNIAFQWQQQQKITASDGAANDFFGKSVSIDGDYAAIGSRESAYIFVGNAVEWSEQQKLTAIDNGNPNSCGFGESVSISGNRVVAGCYLDGEIYPIESRNAGAAYVFVRDGTTWTQEIKLKGLDTNGGDYFGTSVAISGNTVIIGAPDAFWNGGNFGAAYIFVLNGSNWFQQKKLIVETEVPSALFGGSVAISVNTAVIGASGVNNNRGAAYIYVRNGTSWTYQATLLAPDGESFDQFGYSVAIYWNYIIIGAPGDDSDKGAAYVFRRDAEENWNFVRKLTDPEGESPDFFGVSVSVEPGLGPWFIVGSPGDTVNGVSNRGSATIFFGMGGEINFPKITASDGQENDGFGTSVDFILKTGIDDGRVVIGSPSDGISGNQGAAYVFDYYGGSWHEKGKLNAPDGTGNNRFGMSVAGNPTTIIVGASGDNSSQGAAYIFGYYYEGFPPISNPTVSFRAKLTAFDGLPNDRFGQSVDMSGDNVIVGAPFDDIGSNTDQGSAYIFTCNDTSWNFRQKLLSNNSAADLYGFSVAISGGITLVGALNVDVFPSLAERRRQRANIIGTDQGEVTFYGLRFFAPTAAQVSIGGRVLTGKGNAVSRVIVRLTDSNGATRTVSTNTFGYYHFDGVRSGETYTVSVSHKKLQFNPSSRVINVQDEVSDMDFFTEY